jgi:hypothetical protein
MLPTRSNGRDLTLGALEETAVSARNGFACLFSSSDEYEAALISARRAAGRYARPNPQASEATPFFKRLWPMIAFWGCALAVAGVVLLATV